MRVHRRSHWLLLYALVACGDDSTVVDAALDAFVPTDVGVDAPRDVGSDAFDGGFDGGFDASGDGGAPCDVDGMPGMCLDVDECTGTATPGFCPGPANIQCCTGVDAGMDAGPMLDAGLECDPDAMPQPNVGLSEAAGVGGCPDGMIRVSDFCIDRYEASLVDDATGAPWSPYINPGDAVVRAVSLEGAVPQGYISGDQAAAACARAGKRLCTDAEWLRACQGPGGSTYPYGNVRMDGVCNDARAVHPAVEYFMSSEDWVFTMLGHPCINQLDEGLAPTGSHTGCNTAEGAFDMMGNLHEWTADPAGTFRGGFYVDTVRNGNGCLYRTTAHTTPYWDYSTGFRCCADP